MKMISFTDLREAFSLFVKSKPGKVAANDIGVLLKTVGQSCTDEELHAIIMQASEGKHYIFVD
jgi:Ca2+-binding EF-hand superfamily protein